MQPRSIERRELLRHACHGTASLALGLGVPRAFAATGRGRTSPRIRPWPCSRKATNVSSPTSRRWWNGTTSGGWRSRGRRHPWPCWSAARIRASRPRSCSGGASASCSSSATPATRSTSRRRAASSTRWGSSVLRSSRRRREVEPQTRPAVARNSRHGTPSRTKNRSAATTLTVGMGGRPVPKGRPSIPLMMVATDSATLGARLASRCPRHGKPTRGQPDAERLTILPAFWKPPLRATGGVTSGTRLTTSW
jgi:hypothetical protein